MCGVALRVVISIIALCRAASCVVSVVVTVCSDSMRVVMSTVVLCNAASRVIVSAVVLHRVVVERCARPCLVPLRHPAVCAVVRRVSPWHVVYRCFTWRYCCAWLRCCSVLLLLAIAVAVPRVKGEMAAVGVEVVLAISM